jgi:hypothetical protein
MSNPMLPQDEVPEPGPRGSYSTMFGSGNYSVVTTILRALLIILAIVVAAGFVIVLLPQRAVDSTTTALRARSASAPMPDKIAFLYLGDEVKGNEFHIRGVVRNISTAPIEKLDASVRLYSEDGRLLETRVVRMDTESIAPDSIAQFNLTYPDYKGQFGSYSVDFIFRDGQPVPYKDMRGFRGKD